eukprot:GHVU01138565.1.p2 GENE.GHVU01138565.1~~GHVU01138565.1.p2  ORF type:complete len:115 (-),score=8.67 GHVU01138565.1:53-397(-)
MSRKKAQHRRRHLQWTWSVARRYRWRVQIRNNSNDDFQTLREPSSYANGSTNAKLAAPISPDTTRPNPEPSFPFDIHAETISTSVAASFHHAFIGVAVIILSSQSLHSVFVAAR